MRSAAKLEAGAALLQMSSGIRLVSEDGSAAVAPVMFTETQFDVAPATKSAVQDAFSDAADPGRRGRLLDGDRLGHPVSILGGGELVGLVIAAIVLDRHARHPRRRRTPDPERARRRGHRRPRRAVAVGRRRDGVGDPGARRHARPRGRHRLLAVHRQSTPPAAEGRLQPARIHQPRDGHLRERRRLRRDDRLHRAARRST